MLPLETLMRAAKGGEREADLVRADFERAGLARWLRSAIERRLDPALGARVVPAGASAAVSVALRAFYGLWGRWFPSEYRRVRREWVVHQARWRGDAPVDPAPGLDPVASRLLGEGLVAAGCVVVRPAAGGVEAGRKPPEAEGAGGAGGQDPGGAPGGEPGGERDGDGVGGGREPSGDAAAPLVAAGGAVPARLPDGTEVLADAAAGLALSPIGDRLDKAVRGGVAAVEEVRTAWLRDSGAWLRWPSSGRWQERSR